MKRSSVYWDKVIAPQLQDGKTLLIVGHENNLRSLIMRLEGIPREDIINLSLPRAVPLAYRLDENLKPLDRPDGQLDEATGFLRGEWLGGDQAVKEILDRDHKQVYDTSIEQNLELVDGEKQQDKWKSWMSVVTVGGDTTDSHSSDGSSSNGQTASTTSSSQNEEPTMKAMAHPGIQQEQHGPGAVQGCHYPAYTSPIIKNCPDFIDKVKQKKTTTTTTTATMINGRNQRVNGLSSSSSTTTTAAAKQQSAAA